MSINHLPIELSGPIIFELVQSVGLVEATKYRLVCKAFAVSIAEDINESVLHTSLHYILDHKQYFCLFKSRGDKILYEKAISEDSIDDSYALRFIRTTVDSIITMKGPKCESNRRQLTADICRAMMAIEPYKLRSELSWTPKTTTGSTNTPAIAAAIVDFRMLRRSATSSADLFAKQDRIFPDAMHAAVTSNDTIGLKWQIVYIIRELKYKRKAEYSSFLMDAIRNVTSALKTAFRRHQPIAGDILFAALNKLRSLGRNTNITWKNSYNHLSLVWKGMYMDAIRYDSVELISRTLDELQVPGSPHDR